MFSAETFPSMPSIKKRQEVIGVCIFPLITIYEIPQLASIDYLYTQYRTHTSDKKLFFQKPTDLDLHYFIIQYENFYQQPVSSNLIGWKLEGGVAY